MGSDIPELDMLSTAILNELDEKDGSATSSELRDCLDEDTTQTILYRTREKLEPEGLIEIKQPDRNGSGPLPPQEYVLTEKGKTVAGERESELRSNEISERVEQLESQVEEMQEQLSTIQEQITNQPDETAGSPEQESEKLDQLQKQIVSIARDVNRISDDPIISDEEVRGEVDQARAAMTAILPLLMEEYGDELKKKLAEAENRTKTLANWSQEDQKTSGSTQ